MDEMVWTGTGWVRNPALPPLPEPTYQQPKPGFYGGSFVPANINTTIPNAAIVRNPAPPGLGVHASPQTPMLSQHTIPSPVIPPQHAMRAAIMSGSPLPSGFPQPGAPPAPPVPAPGMIPSPLGGGYMIPNPAAEPPPPSRLVPDEGPLVAIDEPDAPRVSATTTVPLSPAVALAPRAPVIPPSPPDPVAEQIAKARAAAQSGKL